MPRVKQKDSFARIFSLRIVLALIAILFLIAWTVSNIIVLLVTEELEVRHVATDPFGNKDPIDLTARFRDQIVVTTDVRGNLGPPEVMLQNGTDWLKDRWQASSDMHGTAIRGQHWVQLEFPANIRVVKVILDWEAAYASDYTVQVLVADDWETLFDGGMPEESGRRKETTLGQSPGVKTKTPLHVVHEIGPLDDRIQAKTMRVLIRHSAMGWGVSLWRIRVLGYDDEVR